MIIYKLIGENNGSVRTYEASENKKVICTLIQSVATGKVTVKDWPELGRADTLQDAVVKYRQTFGAFER